MSDYRQIISHVNFKDFIPYAFYYGSDAILTKNGELIKVIKIACYSDLNSAVSSRALILDFLSNYIESDLSVWLTTIRAKDKNSFNYKIFNEVYNCGFQLDEKWKEYNKIKHFENEFYISIVINDNIDLFGLKNVVPFFNTFDKSYYNSRLNAVYKKLTSKIDRLCSVLVDFSPHVLSIKEYQGVYFSELETFFSRIIKSNHKPRFLSKSNIASSLVANRSVEFLDNEVHLDGDHYCAIFTVKYSCELNPSIILDILHNQFDLVVTEVIFSNDLKIKKNKSYSSSLEKFSYFINASKDRNLETYFKNNNEGQIFLKQTNVMIFGAKDNINLLAYKFNEKCTKYGISIYRENIATEEVFWSQLPGNFHYLMRLKPVFLKQLCNFNNSSEQQIDWHNCLCFSDYYKYGEYFFVDQRNKNINFIFSDKDNLRKFILMLNINFLRFDSLNIINCFEKEYEVPMSSNSVIDGCFLNVLTSNEKEQIEKILTQGMIVIFGNNDKVLELVSVMIKYFISHKILFNLNTFLKKLSDEGLFKEIFDNIKYDDNPKIKFLDIEIFKENDYFNVLSLVIIVSSMQKLILKKDMVFFIKDSSLIDDPNFTEKLKNLFNFAIENHLHLYVCYNGVNSFINQFSLAKESVSYFIFFNKAQESLYKELDFTEENIKYFDSLLQKNIKLLMIKSHNKVLSSNVDLEKFSLENDFLFVKK